MNENQSPALPSLTTFIETVFPFSTKLGTSTSRRRTLGRAHLDRTVALVGWMLLSAATAPGLQIPCPVDESSEADVTWSWEYEQTGPDSVRLLPTTMPSFSVSTYINPDDDLMLSDGLLTVPTNPAREEVWPGFGLSQDFSTEEELIEQFPEGPYRLTMADLGGAQWSQSFTVPPNSVPTTPRLLNYASAQSIDPARDFVLKLEPFPGADRLRVQYVVIQEENQFPAFFHPPLQNCAQLQFPLVADEVRVPAGTLKADKTYQLRLSHTRQIEAPRTLGPLDLSASFSKVTELEIRTLGATPPGQPKHGVVLATSVVTLDKKPFLRLAMDLAVGQTVELQHASNLGHFLPLQTIIGDGAKKELTLPLETGVSQRFFRTIAR